MPAARLAGLLLLLVSTCLRAEGEPRPEAGRVAEVRVVPQGADWQLQVGGRPLFLRGAGLETGDVEALAAAGGNVIRTWRVDRPGESGQALLDRALASGLFVALGLDVGRERHGFDYGDPEAVARQLERLRDEVRRHREHPALLLWVVGNELNLESRDPRVWDAVEDIVRMIGKEDPRHPALTPIAGFSAELIAEIRSRAPSLKLLGVQLYGDIDRLPQLHEAGWDGPYLVTEWGPTGHWEVPRTPWGAPIEDSSAVKARRLQERYRQSILADPGRCLGSFVFLWGQKQERTPTWYGMFLSSGESTAAVDAMQLLWTGRSPGHAAPEVDGLTLEGLSAVEGVTAAPGQALRAKLATYPMHGSAVFDWTLREESRATSVGGDPETLPPSIEAGMRPGEPGQVSFTAPARPGAYRLFVTVRDGRGKAGHANLPFLVADSHEFAEVRQPH
ncbi:hypothetical protein [Pseudomarimonas salicorniae]|uniref:Glycosyl hydrolases family 2, TIM barrel domain n=1 Tax=Pseudomarimonas salicorniae TaxID=2933270 RepID=A0ABT0GIE6_9GAMM|nr:hypothetical protein [Lysobacter sp. CAU 1642]MCK7594316.1 hypothetical protein [Lysobacter sp. CAU 1642]